MPAAGDVGRRSRVPPLERYAVELAGGRLLYAGAPRIGRGKLA